MDVKQMLYMVTIAQEGGISKAAAKLFITQSALDQQLLKLEHELGTPLFYRSRSSFSLTEAGRVYVDYAQRMLELKNEAYRIIHDLAGQPAGAPSPWPSRGAGDGDVHGRVPPLLPGLPPGEGGAPGDGVRRQLELLGGDGLDLGFISKKDGPLPGIDQVTLCQEEFLLITPPDHPLAARPPRRGSR